LCIAAREYAGFNYSLKTRIAIMFKTILLWVLVSVGITFATTSQARCSDENTNKGCTGLDPVVVIGSPIYDPWGGGPSQTPGGGSGGAPSGGGRSGGAIEIVDLGVLNTCSSDPRLTEASKGTVSTDTDLTRRHNANQMLTAVFPNVANTQTGRGNRLRISVQWSDGGAEPLSTRLWQDGYLKGLPK
jgi:hypothetical protein